MPFARIADAVIRGLAHPVAVIGFPLASVAWLDFTGEKITYLVAISIAAISMAQLILYDSLAKERVAVKREQALQEKTNELVRAIPGASNDLIGREADGT